jgi:hypothetical protein
MRRVRIATIAPYSDCRGLLGTSKRFDLIIPIPGHRLASRDQRSR